jgi:hypothetical protein
MVARGNLSSLPFCPPGSPPEIAPTHSSIAMELDRLVSVRAAARNFRVMSTPLADWKRQVILPMLETGFQSFPELLVIET